IILIAEAYDYALLVATEWLSEQYGVDIRCCRIAVAKDSATDSEYLVCSNAYPAPELVDEAVSRGGKRRVSKNLKWHDWETALANITNPAVVAYFRQQRADGREAYLPRRILRYRIGGKQRFSVGARTKNVYVWQHGRFADDLDFWKTRVSQPNKVTPVKGGECLRFYLHTDVDFRSFHNAATQQLTSKEWTDGVSEEEAEEVEAGV
ncbi:MAG: hypothetical protein RBS80_26140, partial [Thermoguttaceae bacterium]|nr:hypothetical protein [Thermoguttaceae bacterium]